MKKPLLYMLTAAVATAPGMAARNEPLDWPEITRETKPWAYNWWLGSAVDQENLARELRRYREGGLGGIHIIPIYGVKGAEARDLPYLGPKWMEMYAFAATEAEKLGLGVDLTTGSGWCFGGPWITGSLAGIKVMVTNGAFRTAPAAPKVKRAAPGGEGPMLNPFYGEAMAAHLRRFTAAFDVPGVPKPRAMYHDSFEYSGPNWSPDVPAEFAARRGYRLEDEAEAFAGRGDPDRAARVRCDYRETLSDLMVDRVFRQWTAWCRARGLVTRNQAHGSPGNWLDFYALADIPETEMFGRGARDPLASGFDGRFLEGDRSPLVSKFASSAAHVAGRKLVSAETGTWMAEHFCETFEELKCLADLLFVSGVNHIIYHGCAYSPDDAAWPGWLFYASTEMNPRNPLWRAAPALNAYVARCQSVLQSGRPDQDVLLYWPIHQTWTSNRMFQFTVHGRDWLDTEPVGRTAALLWEKGWGFDYVSDRLLAGVRVEGGRLAAPGGATYAAVVVPPAGLMPESTLARLLELAEAGGTVVFADRLPSDVPGWGRLGERRSRLREQIERIGAQAELGGVRASTVGRGRVFVGPPQDALAKAGVRRETLADQPGFRFIRRAHGEGLHYFMANQGTNAFDGWLPLAAAAQSVAALDPLTGGAGVAESRPAGGGAEVRLRLEPGHSIILRTFSGKEITGPAWRPLRAGAELARVAGPWDITFVAGGPALPKAAKLDTLKSWTETGDPEAERFGGTAVYRAAFDATEGTAAVLDLGEVRHVAKATLNGRDLGTALMHPYRLAVPAGALKKTGNVLEVEVTNLGANRIRDLDRRKVEWRIFRDINVVNIGYKPFDAAGWPVQASGLLGPVTVRAAER